jgi:hypothetical protein
MEDAGVDVRMRERERGPKDGQTGDDQCKEEQNTEKVDAVK